MRFLSEEWVAAVGTSAASPVDGAYTGRVQHVVSGGPDGDVKFMVAWADGRPTSAAAEVDKEAEVSLTLPFADAVAVAQGEVDLNSLFMQGQMKVTGATGPLLAFLSATQVPAIVAETAERASNTDFA